MKTTTVQLLGSVAVSMVSTLVSAQWNVMPQQQPVRVQQPESRPAHPNAYAQPQNNMRAVPAFPYGQNRDVLPAQPQPPPQYVVPNSPWGTGQPQYPPQYYDPNLPQGYGHPPIPLKGHRPQQQVYVPPRSWSCDSYGGDPYSGHYEMSDNRGHESRREYRSPRYPKNAVLVGEFTSGGEAKEVLVNRTISRCYLELVSGTVSINTVVVRPEKTKLPQTVRLVPGQLHMIDLGTKRAVTGFRISDGGRGVYRVIVQ